MGGCPKCFAFWSAVAAVAFAMLAINWMRVMSNSR